MRKGDEKRRELLNVAEALFCRLGYEKTSVQDILDATDLSKGGFYHHFASKEEVLNALCKRRAEQAAVSTAEMLSQAESPMARINAVLRGFVPLRRDAAEFAAMLLPVMDKKEGRAIALVYQEALERQFQPLLKAEIAMAAAVEAVFPPVKEMESAILSLVNHCWMSIAAEACAALREGRNIEPAALLGMMTKYRRAVELLLDAPYGTIEIIRVEELDAVLRNLG